jgi:hypothetical protein
MGSFAEPIVGCLSTWRLAPAYSGVLLPAKLSNVVSGSILDGRRASCLMVAREKASGRASEQSTGHFRKRPKLGWGCSKSGGLDQKHDPPCESPLHQIKIHQDIVIHAPYGSGGFVSLSTCLLHRIVGYTYFFEQSPYAFPLARSLNNDPCEMESG